MLDCEKQARIVEVEAQIVTGNDHKWALLKGYSADLEVILEARSALCIPSEAVLEGDWVLVGSVGILTIMTIAVSERTTEIGLLTLGPPFGITLGDFADFFT